MKAAVFQGPGAVAWQDVPDPGIDDPGDVIVRVDVVTICGTDLHILKGDVPEVTPGRVLGHEAVGTVVEAGRDVRTVRPGDRVLVSCITACGRCRFCREGRYGQCRGGGGWILGHTVDGTQAEYVRVPFADLSVHPLPSAVDSQDAVLLADIFPTSYEVGVLNGRVRPGDTVVVVGAAPSGSPPSPPHACTAPAGSWPWTSRRRVWPRPANSEPTLPRAPTRSPDNSSPI